MRIVAKKAQGSRKIVAPRPVAAMTSKAFAETFGARPIGTLGDDSNPFTLDQLRSEIAKRLRSTGGRPGLADAEEKWRVGVLRDDVPKIRLISSNTEVDSYKPSAAQVATVLIHMAITRFSTEEIKQTVKRSLEVGQE
jgi:hypothetical protein